MRAIIRPSKSDEDARGLARRAPRPRLRARPLQRLRAMVGFLERLAMVETAADLAVPHSEVLRPGWSGQ